MRAQQRGAICAVVAALAISPLLARAQSVQPSQAESEAIIFSSVFYSNSAIISRRGQSPSATYPMPETYSGFDLTVHPIIANDPFLRDQEFQKGSYAPRLRFEAPYFKRETGEIVIPFSFF